MKSKLNLSSYGVEELNQQEMLNVEGGGFLKKVGEAIATAATAVAGAVVAAYEWAVDHSVNKIQEDLDLSGLAGQLSENINSH
jgi:hypothetical protein